jgi:hypothetical protein
MPRYTDLDIIPSKKFIIILAFLCLITHRSNAGYIDDSLEYSVVTGTVTDIFVAALWEGFFVSGIDSISPESNTMYFQQVTEFQYNRYYLPSSVENAAHSAVRNLIQNPSTGDIAFSLNLFSYQDFSTGQTYFLQYEG